MNTVLTKSFFIVVLLLASVSTAHAQEKQVLSVTPPLFQLSVLPGNIWQSSVKVVNGNSYPLTVYAEIVNFRATGESGQGEFIPVPEGGVDNATLAEWVELSRGPYTIEPEQTKDITFFAEVPDDAAPGGHYAAILISTEEPKPTGELAVQASQAVTSLLFMRIEGDVREEGTIREFRVKDAFLDVPNAEFSLRFENKGNVHLQPRGDIVITNMWGTEQGKIPINYQTHFGNVLPQSIRDFTFAWKSDFSITDVGRYKAIVTLGYGENGVKSTSSIVYFWVIPVKWTLITLAILCTFIWLIVLMVRAYVHRMLVLAGVEPDMVRSESLRSDTHIPKTKATYRTVSAPIRDGVLDLRKRIDTAPESESVATIVLSFVTTYKLFFISIFVLVGIVVTVSLYVGVATHEGQPYQVEIKNEGNTTTLTSEEVSEIIAE